MPPKLESYRLEAYNTAKNSENKMHDDVVARQYGFSGGLVTGVDLLAYLVHLPVAAYGRDFLERGFIEAKFIKPVYDGEILDLEGAGKPDGELLLELNSRGEVCAAGSAKLPTEIPTINLADYLDVKPGERQPITDKTYSVGEWLAIQPQKFGADAALEYADDVRESDPIYVREGLVHPGVIQRLMNRVLVENAVLGPWIHVGSKMQLLSPVAVGDTLTVRAKVVENYEKKGHRFAEFDAVVVANGTRAVAHCYHTAIYAPRQQEAA